MWTIQLHPKGRGKVAQIMRSRGDHLTSGQMGTSSKVGLGNIQSLSKIRPAKSSDLVPCPSNCGQDSKVRKFTSRLMFSDHVVYLTNDVMHIRTTLASRKIPHPRERLGYVQVETVSRQAEFCKEMNLIPVKHRCLKHC